MTNKYEIIKCSNCDKNLTIPEIEHNQETTDDVDFWMCEFCEFASDPT